MAVRVICGDVREKLAELPAGSVQCCVTSPPYFGLRDYGTAKWEGGNAACDHSYFRGGNGESSAKQVTSSGTQKYHYAGSCPKCGAVRVDSQIGLEPTLAEYVAAMVDVFREVRRVLRDDGTVWLNLGDSYTGGGGFSATAPTTLTSKSGKYGSTGALIAGGIKPQGSLKPKDLMMVPARVALALQDDGWWLRSDIIWAKRNCMPESVTDRPTSSHEHIFLLTKSARYFYDADAVREESAEPDRVRWDRVGGANGHLVRSSLGGMVGQATHRNQRNVWHLATEPFSEAHFATFPTEIPRRCIKAGSREGDTVLDPFLGSGTTLMVADQLGRDGIGIELNPEYAEMAKRRITNDAPLFVSVAD